MYLLDLEVPHGPLGTSWNWQGLIVYTWTYVIDNTQGIDLVSWYSHVIGRDSWYRDKLMVLTRTLGINMDSWHWQHPWYLLRLMIYNRYSLITHLWEGRVWPVRGISLSFLLKATEPLLSLCSKSWSAKRIKTLLMRINQGYWQCYPFKHTNSNPSWDILQENKHQNEREQI